MSSIINKNHQKSKYVLPMVNQIVIKVSEQVVNSMESKYNFIETKMMDKAIENKKKLT